MSSRPILSVAIDGPAGAGKSSVAKAVAAALKFRYVDTGAMYRAAAWKVLQKRVPPSNASKATAVARALKLRFVVHKDGTRLYAGPRDVTQLIRSQEVSQAASKIAVIPGVRRIMQGLQRKMGRAGRAVMEGRDIGTVVLPDARYKFYLDASPMERARRRTLEMKAKGIRVDLHATARAIALRDRRDKSRKDSPLKPADDACIIDTTRFTQAEVIKRVLAAVRRRAR